MHVHWGDPASCTCKAVTRDAQAPVKPTISNAALITAVLAMKNLDSRLQVLEQRVTGQGQASDLDARFAAAEPKCIEMATEEHWVEERGETPLRCRIQSITS